MTKLKPLSHAQKRVIKDIANLLIAGELDQKGFDGYMKFYRKRITAMEMQTVKRLERDIVDSRKRVLAQLEEQFPDAKNRTKNARG